LFVPAQPRLTQFLRPSQALGLLAAYDHAKRIGRPLDTHVTIHWSGTVEAAARVPQRLQLLLERMRKWLMRRSFPVLHIWAQEPSKGRFEYRDVPHLHLLVHIPIEHRKDFAAMLEEWVGGILSDHAIRVQAVGAKHWHWRTYLVKGVDPTNDDVELQEIIRAKGRKAIEARGPVEGKRCGVSQNTLGPAARQHWREQERQASLKRLAS
jgi:hypothetical protein